MNSFWQGRRTLALTILALSAQLSHADYFTWSNSNGFQSASKCRLVETDSTQMGVVEQQGRQPVGGVPDRSLLAPVGSIRNSIQHVKVLGIPNNSDSNATQPGGSDIVDSDLMKGLSGVVLQVQGAPSNAQTLAGTPVAGTYWEVEMKDGSYLVSLCGSGDSKSAYVLFNVYTADSSQSIAEVGVPRDNTSIFQHVYGFTTQEAKDDSMAEAATGSTRGGSAQNSAQSNSNSNYSGGSSAGDDGSSSNTNSNSDSSDNSGSLSAMPNSALQSNTAYSVCVNDQDGSLNVRDATLRRVMFDLDGGDKLKVASPSNKKTSVIDGNRATFVFATFPNRRSGQNSGWIDVSYICSSGTPIPPTRPTKAPPKQPSQPTPPPVTQQPPASSSSGSPSLLAPNCAEQIIVSATKRTEANDFHNRPESYGQCAYGVRLELQASGVGGISGGLGTGAVDDIKQLPKYGFVDSGLRDPNQAPAGAIIVFEGADTASYFRTGHYGSPAGNWLGHVTIKGGDGYYYTDGRTKEPALGWSGGKNVEHIRNVAAIFVPGPALINEYKSRCGN